MNQPGLPTRVRRNVSSLRWRLGLPFVALVVVAMLVLIVVIPAKASEDKSDDLRQILLVTAAVTVIVATGLAILIGGRVASSLEALRRQADRIAVGDLSGEVAPVAVHELDVVGQSFNSMTSRLRRSRDEARRASLQLEAVMAGLDDGVVLTDAHGEVVRLNRAAEQMFGVSEERARGRQFVQVTRDHELDALLQATLTSGVARSEAIEHGLSRRILLASASTTAQGEPGQPGLVVMRDLTELRRLERVRRDFVANVSHELRTPITSIRTIVDTLEAGIVDDPAMIAELFQRIVGEIERLTTLVDDLLDLAYIESGSFRLSLEPADPAELARDAGERLLPQVERARLLLEYDLPEALPQVVADRRQVEQVLVNLIHNAIKFTPPDGTITISARQDGDVVVMAVADTGVGIPEDDLTRLFERFYKLDKARRSHGSGLGLAIARHIVQAHGGEITAESKPGQGSTFRFTLVVAGSETAGRMASFWSSAQP